jgi:hypothetical protein
MVRLIDADALKEYFKTIQKYHVGEYSEWYLADVLEQQPTVDAVPVIRCCDCIYFEYFENQFVQMTHCDVHDRCPDYTDYCSWAVRKEE